MDPEQRAPVAGHYHDLTVVKAVDFGLYLDGGPAGEILLPTRFVPEGAAPGAVLRVFLYHDSEGRLIATTQRPLITVGEIGHLAIVSTTTQGAYVDWGLMKDLFVPLSQQKETAVEGKKIFVAAYVDEKTGRVAGTERIGKQLSNETLTVREGDQIDLLIWQTTDLGYNGIINNCHIGLLHRAEVFGAISVGDRLDGFVKRILPENKIDLSLQPAGYIRTEGDAAYILELLHNEGGYLPFNDKSSPEDIYARFSMSKKAFKMAVGGLYKARKIELTGGGIKQVDNAVAVNDNPGTDEE